MRDHRSPPRPSRRAVALALSSLPAMIGAGRVLADPATIRPFGVEGADPIPQQKAWPLAAGEVRLLDGPFLDAQTWNLAFMRRIDPDRLLHSFRLNAGLPSNAQPLGGWEAPSCELRGHFTGHYLSACALAYAGAGDADMKHRGDVIVAGLAQCQAALGEGGYLSAFPIKAFDQLDANGFVWAPFYTLHKIMAGLYEMHVQTGNPQALPVLLGMAGWADAWSAARAPAHMQTILDQEFGGMSEVFYNLAATTSDPRWIAVGDRFVKARFITPLAERRDELQGLHMNTHVPQVIGAVRRYALTGEPVSGEAAAFFWETVTQARTYATGGSSNREHWLAPPHHLAEEWIQAADHQECCCAYNMLKLTRALYQLSPQVRYIDYYERNLLNHRLGTIEPETGRTTYFLSVAPGAWKTLATDDATFWCCTGTAMEDFAKLADAIYARDRDGLFVNLFIASQAHWPEQGVRLEQATRFPDEPVTRITIHETKGGVWSLRLRMPSWTTRESVVLINGAPSEVTVEPGAYLDIRRAWKPGDGVELRLVMPLHAESLRDNPAIQAFVVGPVVLAGQFSSQGLSPDLVNNQQGPAVYRAPITIPAILAKGRPVVERLRSTGDLTYVLDTGEGEVALKPLNQSWARHAVYWTVT